MSSTSSRVPRQPEIENIALTEALKDFGMDVIPPEADIIVHIGNGPMGLFVSAVVQVATIEDLADRHLRGGGGQRNHTRDLQVAATPVLRDIFPEIDALREEAGLAAANNGDHMAGKLRSASDQSMTLHGQNASEKAYNFGVGVLTRTASTMASIVVDTRSDLIEIEMKRNQIDRVHLRIQEKLSALTGRTS